MRLTLLFASLLLAAAAHAQSTGAVPDAAPEAPPPVKSGEVLEPDVTIIEGETETVEEYRVNGVLYMIKVTPEVGPPYYLVDADGDGELESRRSDLDPGFMVPTWMILRW